MVVVTAAQLDSEFLSHGNLHIVDIPPVPDRFENRVRETEDHDVLDRLLAEIVVNTENLGFFEVFAEVFVQGACTGQIVTEGLFDNHPAPGIRILLRQTDCSELLHHFGKERGRDRQIEQDIARQAPSRLGLGDFLFEFVEGLDVVEIPLEIVAALAEVIPLNVLDRTGGKLPDVLRGFCAVAFIITFAHRDTNHGEILRQEAQNFQIVEGREKLAFCQVAGCTENDNRARVSGTVVAGQRLFRHREGAGFAGWFVLAGNRWPLTGPRHLRFCSAW